MNKKVLSVLEFNKILDNLLLHCSTYLGRALCVNTKISTNLKEIQYRLSQVTQMQKLILKKGNIPLHNINSIEDGLNKIKKGGLLSFKELIDIGIFLRMCRQIKEYFNNNAKINESEVNNIYNFFTDLYTNIGIEELILENILDEETINDNASPELLNIRKSIRLTESKIRDTLNNYISSPNYQKYLQDNIISIRNNRFVILVKQEYKNQIKGLVHDTSSSGSTLFIEPNNIVDMNNKIRVLQIEESKEIEKIIYEYCSKIEPILDKIFNNLEIIAIIDFIASKAAFCLNEDMFEPNVNKNKYINLINARHPLIDKNIVVPISLEIDNKYNSMIITGPNTGGKTVTLKTVGLLTLMVQYGMHIPAKEGSSVAIFDNIFVDIGDEQSIEQNLSTFSAHMTNIIGITKKVKPNSLIIMDELGSGTDPVEGAALAIGILEFLNSKDCITLCTTHYSELKTYAMSKNNILNASTQFNIKTLKPTYKLILGVPGKSNAFAISEKLGLDKNILDIAGSYITKDNMDIEDLILKINNEKEEIEKIKKNIQKEYSKIKENSIYLDKEKEKIDKQKNKIIEDARIKSRQLLLDSKQEINDMINEVYNLKTKNAKEIQKTKTKLNKKINTNISKLGTNITTTKKESGTKIENLKIGQTVFVPSFNSNANILKINKDNTIQIQVGVIKTNVYSNEINLVNVKDKNKTEVKLQISSKAQNISSSINVIGKNVDEAVYEIDKYLDDVYISKLKTITIIHGKGTGKLKSGIHDYLKNNKYVKSYRLGNYNEGQDGVTIVEMK